MEELKKLKIPREQMEVRQERPEKNRMALLDQEATHVNECIQKAIEKGQQSVEVKS